MGASVVRSEIEPRANYADYQEELRLDFWFSCAYCTIAEIEASGIGFEIDHYLAQPGNPALISDYGNLMWSCRRCNRMKGNSPTPRELASGRPVLRPDVDDFSEHLELDEQLRIVGRTPAGEWTTVLLMLNHPSLLRLRKIRERLGRASKLVLDGLRALAEIRSHITRLPRDERQLFLRRQANLNSAYGELQGNWLASIRETLASPLLGLELDPTEKLARRKYLKEQRAAMPEELLGPPHP